MLGTGRRTVTDIRPSAVDSVVVVGLLTPDKPALILYSFVFPVRQTRLTESRNDDLNPIAQAPLP